MEQGFPGQHTTTTTVTTSSSPISIRFDKSYIRTLPGMLKAAQAILDLLGFICISVAAGSYSSRGNYFNTVAMIGFWITGTLLALYVFHVVEKFNRIPWLKIEMYFCGALSIFYFAAACVAATSVSIDPGYGAGAFFGFCATAAYVYDAWLKFNGVRSGACAQGQHPSSKPVSTVTSPAY